MDILSATQTQVIMGWDAYPMKNGEPVPCPIGMHAGRYEECLARVSGISVRWQPDEDGEPCMSLETVRNILDDMNDTRTTDEDFNHVRLFLKWCSDNECGVWFSF